MISNAYKTFFGLAVLPLTVFAIAGCGGGATASSAPPKTTSARQATVNVARTDLGKTLVDSKGLTLYLFEKDSVKRSACSGACAGDWPPLRSNGKPTAGTEASASMLGTIPRSDGAPQVTYNGHPLYLYIGDRKPGDTNGQRLNAFGAEWDALSPAGNQISGERSSSGDESSSDAGGYGGY